MAVSTLTEQETKKLQQVVSRVQGLPKEEKAVVNTYRFADKYLRFKLGRRNTGPHSHGLNETQRANLKAAINKAFGIVVKGQTKVAKAPAKASTRKAASGKSNTSKPKATPAATGTGPRPASELAGAQQARAAQS